MDIEQLEQKETETAKQFLVRCKNEGHITSLQLRAGARRLDELLQNGEEDPVKTVLAELESGDVKVGAEDPEADLPKLEDLDDNLSSKQKLLELRNAGSLSPDETRVAARALDKGQRIEDALVDAGAERLLEKVPPPEKSGPMKIGEVVDQNLGPLEESAAQVDNKVVVLEMLRLEVSGKDREGGKDILASRAEELGASPEEIEAVLATAPAEDDEGEEDDEDDGDSEEEEEDDEEDDPEDTTEADDEPAEDGEDDS